MKLKYFILNLIVSSLFLTVNSPFAFAIGGETGNGGTVVVDGQTYTLSDLEFKALPSQQITLGDALVARIQAERAMLDHVLLGGTDVAGAFDNFVDQTVISSMNEYHFVGMLPSLCPPVTDAHGEIVGCAQGSLTFIIPKVFTELSLDDKAEILIEIRLGADPALQDSKVAIAQAAFRAVITATNLNPLASPALIWFSAQELSAINQFVLAFLGTQSFAIVQGGGRILFDQAAIQLDPTSVLIAMNSVLEMKGTAFHASRVEIINSRVVTADFSGDDVEIMNSDIRVDELHLSQANIQESNLTDTPYPLGYSGPVTIKSIMDVSQFTAVNASSNQISLFQGASILLENVPESYSADLIEIKGSDIQLCNSNAPSGQKIDGDHIHTGDCNESK